MCNIQHKYDIEGPAMNLTLALLSQSSTEIQTADKEIIYNVLRHNASIADAIKQVASKAIDDGEMSERQIETVLALSTHVSEELDKLSLAVHELKEKQ
jgi:hypothetical protein